MSFENIYCHMSPFIADVGDDHITFNYTSLNQFFPKLVLQITEMLGVHRQSSISGVSVVLHDETVARREGPWRRFSRYFLEYQI